MKKLFCMILTGFLFLLMPMTSIAGDNQWTGTGPFATGLGNRVITALALSPDGRTVYAGTGSGTVFSYTYPVTPPTVTTSAATSITATGATLNGTVNANGDSTTVTFDYGLTASYGSSATASQSPVSGSSDTAVSASVPSLSCNTLYHFQVKGVNGGGATNGGDLTFTTSACPTYTYTVTYNGNGNTGGWAPTDGNTYHITDTVTVLGNTGTLVKTGYTFTGWNTAANGSGTHYAAGATFAMGSANVTLYAQWTAINYTVTYNGNGNTGGSVPTDGNTYHITNTVTVLGNTGGLVKTGYTFAGWNTAANGSGTSYSAGNTFAMGSSNVTLYAQWTANEYRVEFVTDGTARATLAGDLVQTVAHGTACTPVTAIAPPGGEFLGWSGGYTGMENPVTVTNVTSALTIVANFEVGQVAYGSLFEVDARDAGLDQFTVKPEVYTTFTNPVTGREGQKATVKVLTTIDREVGAATLVCEWSKRLRLYDAKAFRAAENSGVGAAGWITEANQHDLVMDLRLASTEAEDQSIQSLVLAVPVITAIIPGDPDPDGNATLVILGKWFGTKKPNAWREYVVQGRDGEVVKRQAMKVVSPSADNTGLIDNKGEPSYMDPVTGDSQLIVVVPARLPDGVLNGTIVLENGVGLASWRWEAGSHPAGRPE